MAMQDNQSTFTTVADCVTCASIAYKKDKEAIDQLVTDLPEWCEIIAESWKEGEGASQYSFQSVVIINHQTKEIVFATAGTRSDNMHDIHDDLRLLAGTHPKKKTPAEKFNLHVLQKFKKEGIDISEYNMTFTGHSLGAVMAQIQAADMDIYLQKADSHRKTNTKPAITSITFENPGAKEIIEQIYEKAGFAKDAYKKLNFKVFNNRKNIINNLNLQAGEVLLIVPDKQKQRTPNPVQLLFELLEKLTSLTSRILSKIMAIFAPGGIGKELEKDHRLKNFKKIFNEGKGVVMQNGRAISTHKGTEGLELLKYDAKFVEIVEILHKAEKFRDEEEKNQEARINKILGYDEQTKEQFCMRKELGSGNKVIKFSAEDLGYAYELSKKYKPVQLDPSGKVMQDFLEAKDKEKQLQKPSAMLKHHKDEEPKMSKSQKILDKVKEIVGIKSKWRLEIDNKLRTVQQAAKKEKEIKPVYKGKERAK